MLVFAIPYPDQPTRAPAMRARVVGEGSSGSNPTYVLKVIREALTSTGYTAFG